MTFTPGQLVGTSFFTTIRNHGTNLQRELALGHFVLKQCYGKQYFRVGNGKRKEQNK